MIKIIVDSTTDLPQDYYEKYDINSVPLIVNINNVEYKDKKTISVNELYQSLKDGADVKTSQPNPQDVYDAIENELKNNHDVIFITISQKLSGTYQTIYMVAKDLEEKYPESKIEIIDSMGGSALPGLMAIQASRLVQNNLSFDEIIELLKEMALHGEHIFTVENLKYLFKSGRLGRATALIGNLLHVKPILVVDKGEIKLFKKIRGKNKALKAIIDMVEERIKGFKNQTLAIMHAGDLDVALKLKQMIIDRMGKIEMFIGQIGSALGTHLGIGGVGVFFFNKRPRLYFERD